jgi:DNA-binding transcriptional LysR family regulator
VAPLDLHCLRVFCSVFETGSVSRAAENLGLTQPSVSYSLARLRETFNDPIFNRTREGMAPTPQAARIYREVRRGIDILDAATSPTTFDPAMSERTFRVAMSDIGQLDFLPKIVPFLQTAAPRVSLEIAQISMANVARALDIGELDFAIGNLPEICTTTRYTTVFRESYVCLFRKGHPLIGDKLTRKVFDEAKHILVMSPFTGHHMVESALLERNIHRKIVLRVPHFTSVPTLVAATDYLVSLPSIVAKTFERSYGLRSLPLPIALPDFDVRLHWSARHEANDGHAWMRDTLVSQLKR